MMLHAMAELVGLHPRLPETAVDERSLWGGAVRGDRDALAALLRAQAGLTILLPALDAPAA